EVRAATRAMSRSQAAAAGPFTPSFPSSTSAAAMPSASSLRPITDFSDAAEGGSPSTPDASAVACRGDVTEGRAGRRSSNSLKKCRVGDTKHWHDQCTVEVVVAHFAGSLGHQRAAVTCGPMQPTVFQALARHMLSADGVIRAQRTHSQRLHQMVLRVARLLHKAAQGPLCIEAPRVQQYAKTLGQHVRVDSLAYRAGGIAAAHRERLDEEVRESVQQYVRATRK